MENLNFDNENATTTCVIPNLESGAFQVVADNKIFKKDKFNNQEFNKNYQTSKKKNISLISKRNLQKSNTDLITMQEITNSSSIKPLPNARKRKISNSVEVIVSESDEFNGFDNRDLEIFGNGSIILKKLLDEAEMLNDSTSKRRRTSESLWKHTKNANSVIEGDENMTNFDDQKLTIASNISSTNFDELSLINSDNLANDTSVNVNRLKKNRSFRVASPSNTARQKISIDITNPLYREPFNYGWKRELVYRAGTVENQSRRMADIYYYTPEGKKVRSYREVIEFLTASELTIDNFTFFKEPLGVNDPNKEVIRDAKKAKDFPSSKIMHQFRKTETLPVKKSLHKKSIDKSLPEIEATTIIKPIKTATTLKVKLPTKKAAIKIDEEKEMRSSPNFVTSTKDDSSSLQWSSMATRKIQNMEKSTIVKSKKITKKKQVLPEFDYRQHFMVAVCSGYHALSRIFQYLKVQELLRAARVCRMWRDLAAHPSLWKTVRMKNSQVTDWDGLADTLKNRGTQHLDLRKMLIVGEPDTIWKTFVIAIPRVTTLIKLELCRCPAMVVEEIMKNCSQLQVLSAMSIKCDCLNLEFVSNLSHCNELRLKAINGMSFVGDLTPLLKLSKISYLSLTSIKDLGKKKIDIIQSLYNLKILELGECSDFPDKFGTTVLMKLQKLERLRLEKGQGSCCTFDILNGISKMKNLTQLELVNFDVKNGFDQCLAECKNLKRLLIIPTYVSQSATSNNMILGGVTELSNNLTHFVWGVTQELLRVTELFVDQCNQMSKQITGDSIPVLKPVPCLNLIEDVMGEKYYLQEDEQISNSTNPQVEILPLPHLQKLLLTALPKTRVKILKIPFHATWRQSISDTTSQ